MSGLIFQNKCDRNDSPASLNVAPLDRHLLRDLGARLIPFSTAPSNDLEDEEMTSVTFAINMMAPFYVIGLTLRYGSEAYRATQASRRLLLKVENQVQYDGANRSNVRRDTLGVWMDTIRLQKVCHTALRARLCQ